MSTSTGLVILALAWSLIILAIAVNRVPEFKWWGRMGTAKWDPTTSWASTLTAIGALVGAVIAVSPALPGETHMFPKKEFAGLSIFFGGINLFAPFVYNVTRRGSSPELLNGYVWAFVAASAMTLWAVTGQLITLGLLVREMYWQATIALLVSVIFGVLILLAIVIMIPYVKQSVRFALKTGNPLLLREGGEVPLDDWRLL